MSRLDFQPALHAYMELEGKQVRNQPNSPQSFFVLDRLERRDRAEGEVTRIITLPGELQCYMFLRLTKGCAREGGNYSELICMQIDGLRLEGGFAQGAGVMATKEFKKGEMMLVVPATAMMTSATAICSKVCNHNLFWF